MWHLGQASRAGDVTTAKQLLRRLMDEDVLKTAVQGEWNHPLRSEKLFWSVPRLVLVGVPWICGVAEAKDRFFLTAYYMLSDLLRPLGELSLIHI